MCFGARCRRCSTSSTLGAAEADNIMILNTYASVKAMYFKRPFTTQDELLIRFTVDLIEGHNGQISF